MGWIVASMLGVALIGYIALKAAIAHNGPAVLDSVDWIASRGGPGLDRTMHSYGNDRAQRLYVLEPKGTAANAHLPVALFIHGGGWATGDPRYYDFVARALAPHGIIVVNAGYRLGKAGRYPAMLEDSAAAVGWTYRHIGQFGGDPENLFLIGHSAGAYNVMMLALERQWLGREGLPEGTIKGVIGLAGPYDFYPFKGPGARGAFGHTANPRATQPINHVRADAPAIMLIQGEADTTVNPRNARALAKALREKGAAVETHYYPGWDHNDPLLALASPWRNRRDIVSRIAALIKSGARSSVSVQAKKR